MQNVSLAAWTWIKEGDRSIVKANAINGVVSA